jgi:SAM-dependent methyltransferase
MNTFNQAQFDDFLAKSFDLYAQTKYKLLLDSLSTGGRLRLLNAGCGSGELSILLAAQGHDVVGIDPEPAYVKLAEENARRAGVDSCRFETASIEAFRSRQPFDGVVSTDVLEHIEDDVTAMRKLASLVRPGGKVLLTVPAGPWLFGYHDEQLGHFRRYSPKTLRALVAPFCESMSVRTFGFTLLPVCLMYSKWLRRPYPVAESCDTARSPWRARILKTLLEIDRRVPMPLGTSLLLQAVRSATDVDAPLLKAA